MRLNKANKLALIEDPENDKENLHTNNLANVDNMARFNQIVKPKLSIQRKCLDKVEKEMGIRKWSKAD